MDIFIVAVRVPVVVNLLGVHNGEEVRDRDVLGAAVRAVAAGRAGLQARPLRPQAGSRGCRP